MDSLEERLKEHARAFDGLLSIIPAKDYYGEDRSNQWQRKKQTKEEARSAKRAKLDPDNYKSAKDVLDEQAAAAIASRKRKRSDDEIQDDTSLDGYEKEEPLVVNGAKVPLDETASKKEKVDDRSSSRERVDEAKPSEDAVRIAKAEKRKEKRIAKKEKSLKQAQKIEAKKARKTVINDEGLDSADVPQSQTPKGIHKTSHERPNPANAKIPTIPDTTMTNHEPNDVQVTQDFDNIEPTSSSSAPSVVFEDSADPSGSSSITSLPASNASIQKASGETPLTTSEQEVHKKSNGETPSTVSKQESRQKPNAEELKARLQARIDALRNARKADGPAGTKGRSRQELLESRRQKEEARKAHKKELKRRAREEEARQKAEILATGSPLFSPNSPRTPNNEPTSAGINNTTAFSYGTIDFGSGDRASHTLDAIHSSKSKPRGPSDPQTALIAAQTHKARIASLDESKRKDIEEKDAWLNATKRAHGERVRDDVSLLKKALKRKEKQKKKSTVEWDKRVDGVKKAQEMKQKKRETNLQKRRDDKLAHKLGGAGGKKGKSKVKARPGFEGSFRAKAPASSRKK